jgi:hypothetical protein
MAQYLVTWEIDIYADSDEEAAAKALEIQRDVNSTATFFRVRHVNSGEEIAVDVLDTE